MAEQFFPDELAEADFFIQQGLYDEAKEILQRILEDLESPRASRMLRTAEALERGEEPPGDDPPPAAPAAAAEDDSAFDLARELEGDLGDLGDASGLSAEPTEQVSVETVLAEFKRGVDKVVAQDDADTHHDLGIAYKEMGLLEDAVGEFQRSCRSPKKEADAYYMMGLCRVDQGQMDLAVEAWRRALLAAQIQTHQRAAVGYELADALEHMGDKGGALEAFIAVSTAESTFKDVQERIQRLKKAGAVVKKPGGGGGGTPQAAKGKNIGYI